LTFKDGKETCRSDPIEFIVPTKKPDTPKTGSAGKAEANENVIITILNETIPYDLPGSYNIFPFLLIL
jgi:hypothetical protein